MMRRRAIAVLCVLLAATLAVRLKRGGAPYLEKPVTVLDHVGPKEHPVRPTLALVPRLVPAIPRGATVACFEPVGGRAVDDLANTLTARHLLPDHRVVAASAVAGGARPEFVIAVRAPFADPSYAPIAEHEEGRLYRLKR